MAGSRKKKKADLIEPRGVVVRPPPVFFRLGEVLEVRGILVKVTRAIGRKVVMKVLPEAAREKFAAEKKASGGRSS